ncbi:hypothetical protein [Laceyella putida]|uniref:Uncharacterized protein n=1 Tax=Laceyella putida TaxID=110101 RepID=A0ABW2RM21_9BACL
MNQEKKANWVKSVVFCLLGLLFLVLIFGVYVLPMLPKEWVGDSNDPDTVANQIASMSFLLTFISTIGAVGGIGFTIFGYFQSTRIPEMVEKEVDKRYKEIDKERRLNDERHQKEIEHLKKVNEELNSKWDELSREIMLLRRLDEHYLLYAYQYFLDEINSGKIKPGQAFFFENPSNAENSLLTIGRREGFIISKQEENEFGHNWYFTEEPVFSEWKVSREQWVRDRKRALNRPL